MLRVVEGYYSVWTDRKTLSYHHKPRGGRSLSGCAL